MGCRRERERQRHLQFGIIGAPGKNTCSLQAPMRRILCCSQTCAEDRQAKYCAAGLATLAAAPTSTDSVVALSRWNRSCSSPPLRNSPPRRQATRPCTAHTQLAASTREMRNSKALRMGRCRCRRSSRASLGGCRPGFGAESNGMKTGWLTGAVAWRGIILKQPQAAAGLPTGHAEHQLPRCQHLPAGSSWGASRNGAGCDPRSAAAPPFGATAASAAAAAWRSQQTRGPATMSSGIVA